MIPKDFFELWSDFLGKGYEVVEVKNEAGYVIERYIVGEELVCEDNGNYPTGEPKVKVIAKIPVKLREIYEYIPVIREGDFVFDVSAFVIDHTRTRRVIEKNGEVIFDQTGGAIEE